MKNKMSEEQCKKEAVEIMGTKHYNEMKRRKWSARKIWAACQPDDQLIRILEEEMKKNGIIIKNKKQKRGIK